jgi:hypothetical protein
MRVWVGGVETFYPARWFFCPTAARHFDGAHGAESSVWLKDNEVNLDWGEVAGKKILDKGVNPGYSGQCTVGDPQWFVDGVLPADFNTYTTPVVTPCCGHVPPANPDSRCPQPVLHCIPSMVPQIPIRVITSDYNSDDFYHVYDPYYNVEYFNFKIPSDVNGQYIRFGETPTIVPCFEGVLGWELVIALVWPARGIFTYIPLFLTFVSYDMPTKTAICRVPESSLVYPGELITVIFQSSS